MERAVLALSVLTPERLTALAARLDQHAYDLINGGTNATDLRTDCTSAAAALRGVAAGLNLAAGLRGE